MSAQLKLLCSLDKSSEYAICGSCDTMFKTELGKQFYCTPGCAFQGTKLTLTSGNSPYRVKMKEAVEERNGVQPPRRVEQQNYFRTLKLQEPHVPARTEGVPRAIVLGPRHIPAATATARLPRVRGAPQERPRAAEFPTSDHASVRTYSTANSLQLHGLCPRPHEYRPLPIPPNRQLRPLPVPPVTSNDASPRPHYCRRDMQRPAHADSVKTSDGATSRPPEATPIEAPGAPRMHFTSEIAQPRVVRPLPRVPPPPPLSFGAPRRTEASTFADEVMNAWSRLKSVMDRDPREQSRTFSRK